MKVGKQMKQVVIMVLWLSHAGVAKADWQKSDFDAVVLVKCQSPIGEVQGSGVVIDEHVVVTASHVVIDCFDRPHTINVLDRGNSRSPERAFSNKIALRANSQILSPGQRVTDSNVRRQFPGF